MCRYERGANIGDTQVLLGVAAKLGLEEEARQRLGAPRSSSAAAAALTAEAPQGGAADDGASCGLGDGAACAAAPAAAAQQQQQGKEEEESVDGELLREVELDDATAKQRCALLFSRTAKLSAEGREHALLLLPCCGSSSIMACKAVASMQLLAWEPASHHFLQGNLSPTCHPACHPF